MIVTEPKSMGQALSSDQAEDWKRAAEEEYSSLMEHETWELTELPVDRTPVGCKWVFKIKRNENGDIERYKCRLVAQGFSQTQGIDYDETFAPVARFNTIRSLLAMAVNRGVIIEQMDVVTAFLNGELKEEIFMSQPPGFVEKGKEELVCRLKRSLYGLKQSSRCWYDELRVYLTEIEFQQCTSEPCVFYRWQDDSLSIVTVYVDDLIIMVDVIENLIEIKEKLASRFKMKDMGSLSYCLGIGVRQSDGMIQIHQRQYIASMLQRFGMQDAYPVHTPSDPSVNLVKDDGVSAKADKRLFQQIIGSLQYAVSCTRPDIAYAVNNVARYSSDPSEAHLTAAKRILRYLKGTIDLAITYVRTYDDQLIGYSDADWAGDQDSRKSTSGNLFLLGSGAITWASKKQTSVALSTVEAEYISLCLATQEVAWIRQLFDELDQKPTGPTVIMEDNQGAIAVAHNPVNHKRTKHIDIKYHYVRDAVESGMIELRYCRSSDIVADALTKALVRDQFEGLRAQMGLIPIE